MNTIKLPDLSLEKLDVIVESLNFNYVKTLKKVQRAGARSLKMSKELSLCQTVLQEFTSIANNERWKLELAEEEASDIAGSAFLRGEETGTS